MTSLFSELNSMQPTKGARLRGGGSWVTVEDKQKQICHPIEYITTRKVGNTRKRSHLDVWRDSTHKEHRILGVQVKQGVGAWSFAFLDELLLICEALAGDGQEHLSMSTQPARAKKKKVVIKGLYARILSEIIIKPREEPKHADMP